MVTVVKTPQGHKIIDQAVTAAITEDYVGDAVVTLAGHSLTTGDTVYITSDIDEYNGFWYVTTITVDTFKISEHSESDFVEYYQDADIEYYQTQPHDWSSIFLPIVYKATNTFWPTNSVDTARTVSSFSDDNGFTQVTLSGALRSSVRALEFVEVSGMADSEYNGVWQIVEVTSTSDVVLNLPYADDLSFSGATIQYYYNNYQVKVKIFSGLPASHPWYAKKPYAEVAELSLTPDENNEVMFSVADYIQGQVNIRNNPTLFSMPLNLDAFTGFYIATSESYDQSDNYSLYTTESSFTNDSFQGYAIAGKLPFKNVYSGDYADYVYTSGSPAQWLTNRTRLLAVDGYYFDVSFIKNIVGDLQVIIDKYVADYPITETQTITDQGIGVYRIPVTPDVNYDSFCLYINVLPTGGSGGDLTPIEFPGLDEFIPVGSGTTWTTGANPTVTLNNANSLFLRSPAFSFSIGETYKITATYTVARGLVTEPNHWIYLRATDTPNATFFSSVEDTSTSGTIILEFTAADPIMNRIHFYVTESTPFDVDITITSLLVETVSPVIPPTAGGIVTEQICIDILETCEVEGGFTPETARRLTEDGGYRLLE